MADGESLVLEWKIVFERKQNQFAYDPQPNVKRRAVQVQSRLPEEFKQVENPDKMMELPLAKICN